MCEIFFNTSNVDKLNVWDFFFALKFFVWFVNVYISHSLSPKLNAQSKGRRKPTCFSARKNVWEAHKELFFFQYQMEKIKQSWKLRHLERHQKVFQQMSALILDFLCDFLATFESLPRHWTSSFCRESWTSSQSSLSVFNTKLRLPSPLVEFLCIFPHITHTVQYCWNLKIWRRWDCTRGRELFRFPVNLSLSYVFRMKNRQSKSDFSLLVVGSSSVKLELLAKSHLTLWIFLILVYCDAIATDFTDN